MQSVCRRGTRRAALIRPHLAITLINYHSFNDYTLLGNAAADHYLIHF